jgi:site-specific recombinase XerD
MLAAMQAFESLETLYAERAKLKLALLAANTRRGYHYDWLAFRAWCDRAEVPSLPASVEAVSLHVTALLIRGRKVSTVARRAAVVAHMHRAHDLVSPVTVEVRELLRGARRTQTEEARQVRPLSVADLRQCSRVLRMDGSARAVRDRAVLVVGFASALRSVNLATLAVADVEFCDRGLVLTIYREKTNQEGRCRLIGLPKGNHRDTCPVRCLRAWLDRRGLDPGYVFSRLDTWGDRKVALQPERFCQILQSAVARIGLDPKLFGSHSLRSGFVTEAGEAGVGELLIAAQTGHRDMSTLRRYFRRRDLFKSNACTSLGL